MRKKKTESKKSRVKDDCKMKISLTWGSCFKFWLIGFAMFTVFAMLWAAFTFLTK
jgi:hypothetical protein